MSSKKTQKLVNTLFTVQFAKGDTVYHSKGHEVLEVSTDSSSEVVSIIAANERIKLGHNALGQALMDAGISIPSAHAAAVRQVFGKTIVYARLKVASDDRTKLAKIISTVNTLGVVE